MLRRSYNHKQYKFVHEISRLSFVEEIWLYGSRARGDNSERSDMDIAILCPNATNGEWSKVLAIVESANTLLKIDAVRFDSLKNGNLKSNIESCKYVLYTKVGNYMSKLLWQDYFATLGRAIDALKEVLDLPNVDKVSYLRDATIQRFEFTIELYWRVLKKFLAHEKIDAVTPRDVFNKAFQYHLIDDDVFWVSMLDDRNSTSHIYSEEQSLVIFMRIKDYHPIMRHTYERLQKKFDELG